MDAYNNCELDHGAHHAPRYPLGATVIGESKSALRQRQRQAGRHDRSWKSHRGYQWAHGSRAGEIVPTQVPKPIRAKPARSQNPLKVTSSPSSKKTRCSEVGNRSGVCPRLVISRRLPKLASDSPEIVPEPMTSPISTLQPLLVWCATICATVQYRDAAELWLSRSGAICLRTISFDRR